MESKEIASDLRTRIETAHPGFSGHPRSNPLPAGSELPTVGQLAHDYGASRETVHRALRQLRDLGLIHARRGRPYVVADTRPLWTIEQHAYHRSIREAVDLTTFEQQCAERGMAARTFHRVESPVVAPEWVAEILGGPRMVAHLSGDGWVTPMGADGHPDPSGEHVAGIYDTWVPLDVAEASPVLLGPRGDDNRHEWVGGVYSAVERATGGRLIFRDVDLYARPATFTESTRFDRDIGWVDVEDLTATDMTGRALVVDRNVKRIGTVRRRFTVPIH